MNGALGARAIALFTFFFFVLLVAKIITLTGHSTILGSPVSFNVTLSIAPANCTDGFQNQNETGVDCGEACNVTCPTCSDDIQNQDETGIDCGGSCAACPSPPSSSGGGGGGGGGASFAPGPSIERPSRPSVVPAVKFIDTVIERGQNQQFPITIDNFGNESNDVDIEIQGNVSLILHASELEISLDPRSTRTIVFSAHSASDGTYSGTIRIRSTDLVQDIPVRIVVQSRPQKLLDVALKLKGHEFRPGTDLDLIVDVFNFGQLGRYDIELQYRVKRLDDGRDVISKVETVAIETSLSLSRTLKLPELPEGKYLVSVVATYGSLHARAEDTFTVTWLAPEQETAFAFRVPTSGTLLFPVIILGIIVSVYCSARILAIIEHKGRTKVLRSSTKKP